MKRYSFEFPWPRSGFVWFMSFLILGLQIALLVVMFMGLAPWWACLAGILVVELLFRWARPLFNRDDPAPPPPVASQTGTPPQDS